LVKSQYRIYTKTVNRVCDREVGAGARTWRMQIHASGKGDGNDWVGSRLEVISVRRGGSRRNGETETEAEVVFVRGVRARSKKRSRDLRRSRYIRRAYVIHTAWASFLVSQSHFDASLMCARTSQRGPRRLPRWARATGQKTAAPRPGWALPEPAPPPRRT